MSHIIGPMDEFADGPRMLIRSAHIYLLLGAAANIFYGLRFKPQNSHLLQGLESIILLIAPVLILISFFNPPSHVADIPLLISLALYGLFGVAAFVFLRAEILPRLIRILKKGTSKN